MWPTAYPPWGYPQTSGLLTAGDDGAAYVYFFDNYTPGILRVLKDQPGQTSAELENENGHSVGYALFTPMAIRPSTPSAPPSWTSTAHCTSRTTPAT